MIFWVVGDVFLLSTETDLPHHIQLSSWDKSGVPLAGIEAGLNSDGASGLLPDLPFH